MNLFESKTHGLHPEGGPMAYIQREHPFSHQHGADARKRALGSRGVPDRCLDNTRRKDQDGRGCLNGLRKEKWKTRLTHLSLCNSQSAPLLMHACIYIYVYIHIWENMFPNSQQTTQTSQYVEMQCRPLPAPTHIMFSKHSHWMWRVPRQLLCTAAISIAQRSETTKSK